MPIFKVIMVLTKTVVPSEDNVCNLFVSYWVICRCPFVYYCRWFRWALLYKSVKEREKTDPFRGDEAADITLILHHREPEASFIIPVRHSVMVSLMVIFLLENWNVCYPICSGTDIVSPLPDRHGPAIVSKSAEKNGQKSDESVFY